MFVQAFLPKQFTNCCWRRVILSKRYTSSWTEDWLLHHKNMDVFPQQRKLMGSSAQNSSGVHWCRRRVRFNEVPEKVPKVPEKVWEASVQSQVRFNRVPEKVPEKVWEALVQSQVRFNRVPEKVPEKVLELLVRSQVRFNRGSGEGSEEGL